MKKLFIFLFSFVLLLAAIPRSIELINHNYLFGFDQGLFYMAVKSIVIDHKFTLIGAPVGGAGGFFQGPGWYYLLAIPFVLAKGDPYAGMIMMWIIALAVVASAMIFLKKYFNTPAALMTGFLLAVSPGIISQARFIWPPFPISLLSVLFLYALYITLQKKMWGLPLLGFTLGVLTHFETATAATLGIQFLLFIPVLLWKKLLSLKSIILSFVAIIITQIPLILFDLRHQFLNTKGMIGMFHTGHRNVIPFNHILFNHWQVFWGSLVSTFYGADIVGWVFVVFFILGTIWYLKSSQPSSSQKLFVWYLFTSPVILFLVFLLYKTDMWAWWILELCIFYCFLLGILLSFISTTKLGKLGVILFIGISFIAYVLNVVSLYKHDLGDYGGTSKIKGKLDAIDYIYHDAHGEKFGLLAFTPPIYTYDTDYLVWWYGQQKYGYLPYQEKKGELYLLISPDPEKPWSYKGWLETVIKVGTIEKTVTLPSGFIIQKRKI